jgi:hypothetical protein
MITSFRLGAVYITANAERTLEPADVIRALVRHTRGDWGELDPEDWQANEQALVEGGRLLSVYRDGNDVRFYIITEWDRSATTVLLPEDY